MADATVIEGGFTRDSNKWPFQVDEVAGADGEFRVVRTDADGNEVGDFIFAETDEGDVLVVCRRFDEAGFGSINVVLA